MDADQWQECTDSYQMLSAVPEEFGSDRKDRLLLAALCRSIWAVLTHPGSREAVEVIERYAEGEVTWEELEAVRSELAHDPDNEGLDAIYEATFPNGNALMSQQWR